MVFSLWVSLIRELRSSALIYSLQLNGRLHNKLLYVCAESRKASKSWSRVITKNHTCTKSPVSYARVLYDTFVAVQSSYKGAVCWSTPSLNLLQFDLQSWPSGGGAVWTGQITVEQVKLRNSKSYFHEHRHYKWMLVCETVEVCWPIFIWIFIKTIFNHIKHTLRAWLSGVPGYFKSTIFDVLSLQLWTK